MATYQVSRQGRIVGLFTLDEIKINLRSGKLVESDFYWKTGMAEWRTLSQFEILEADDQAVIKSGAFMRTYTVVAGFISKLALNSFKFLTVIIAGLVLTGILVSILDKGKDLNQSPAKSEIPLNKDELLKSIWDLEKQSQNFRKSYETEYDEFEKVTIYRNVTLQRGIGRRGRPCLYASVQVEDDLSSPVRVFVSSHYSAGDWIFHDKFKLKIGSSIYESPEISTFSTQCIHKVERGGIYESCHFNSVESVKIVKVIVQRNPDDEATLRLIGRNSYSESTLSAEEKMAFDGIDRFVEILTELRKMKRELSNLRK